MPISSEPQYVLIAEDNLINQTCLNRQLMKYGFYTALASNGRQAIETVKELARNSQGLPQRFSVILMDCEMPIMDGFSAVREIRRMEATGELPSRSRIFALTGNTRAAQIQSARDAGMDEIFIKPYRLEDLVTKIREM
ncbi:CheY-like protein [Sistotremastrum niveocremeum HHB9708]|uniref:CheY-like protein n=1 Tax=Sistotremastrum niveocremeum HHB9708 TaxID=1314777 RepID=A0A164QK46_9AGAM|nr:CheY-like protein [Sistotremastrum niveocremeum HHB9708]